MNRGHWTNKDLEKLKASYDKIDFTELCKDLNRTAHSVRAKALQLQLTLKRVDYSKEDDAYILANHKQLTIAQMAEHLGRTHSGVNKRLFKIRTREIPNYAPIMSQIEANVPIIESLSDSYRKMLDSLKIGDSFLFPKNQYATLQNQFVFFKERKFKTRSETEEESRLWRIS